MNRITTDDSALLWYWEVGGNCSGSDSWRSGSGTNQNPCDPFDGWLPKRWYDMFGMYDEHNGDVIDGRAWRLQDKQCYDGTWRTALFIHSEETVQNRQYCPTSGDDPHCWEGTFDFHSDGCVKLQHDAGITGAHARWHNYGGPTGHGPDSGNAWNNRLYVYG